jgi:uncharacterized membrane protein YfcA
VLVGLLMVASGAAAGVFGSLLGLGGGILIVPLLTLGFNLPLREAVGVSLVCVIMTSSAAAGVYLERHVANLRLGMTLELFTATGALVGGSIAFLLNDQVLSFLFAGLLFYVAVTMFRGRGGRTDATPAAVGVTDVPASVDDDSLPSGSTGGGVPATAPLVAAPSAAMLSLSGEGYLVRNLPIGIVGATFAGIASALLGIGGGIIKVPLMNLSMGVPLRVATATSNMMIGITAAASAVIYLIHGGIDPYVAGPTAIGVFIGATAGSRLGHRVNTRMLRILFVVVLVYTAIEMLFRALGIKVG